MITSAGSATLKDRSQVTVRACVRSVTSWPCSPLDIAHIRTVRAKFAHRQLTRPRVVTEHIETVPARRWFPEADRTLEVAGRDGPSPVAAHARRVSPCEEDRFVRVDSLVVGPPDAVRGPIDPSPTPPRVSSAP